MSSLKISKFDEKKIQKQLQKIANENISLGEVLFRQIPQFKILKSLWPQARFQVFSVPHNFCGFKVTFVRISEFFSYDVNNLLILLLKIVTSEKCV